MAKKKQEAFDVTSHVLVPLHEKCSDKEKQEVLTRYNVDVQRMPRIPYTDPAIQHLGVEEGDLIKITRKSTTAGSTTYYRVVSME